MATLYRKEGTDDAMVWSNNNAEGAWPTQQSPIYGIEYDISSPYRRFLTIRIGNLVIVEFSNKWIPGKASTGNWDVRCPKNMLFMGLTCDEGMCDHIEILCGKAGNGFEIASSKNSEVIYKRPGMILKCPDGMYAQGV